LLTLPFVGSHEITFVLTDGSVTTHFTNYKIYEFIQGEDLEIDLEDEENAIFEVDCDYSKFANQVTVEGEELDSSCYTSRPGSTIVELYYDYLKTLEADEDYDITIYFDDGIAKTEFEIDDIDDDEVIEYKETPVKLSGTPTKTGDNPFADFFRFFIFWNYLYIN
ncbi:MAG: hypothetical protein MJ189_04330, partial [Coriobacteriales bacterium]|nr:hypothetical protein [Coriobacteriales bacterium]